MPCGMQGVTERKLAAQAWKQLRKRLHSHIYRHVFSDCALLVLGVWIEQRSSLCLALQRMGARLSLSSRRGSTIISTELGRLLLDMFFLLFLASCFFRVFVGFSQLSHGA